MSEKLQGGCKCGLVRYAGSRIEAPMFRCHCRDCQQLTGTGHADMVPLDAQSFSLSEICRIYEMQGGSGKSTFSGFCPECGAPILRRSERMSDRVYVHAASLDDPSLYRPERSIYAEAAAHWDGGVIS